MMKYKLPKPPKGLGLSGKIFWKKIVSEFEIDMAQDFERLRVACDCLDQIFEAKKTIVKDGRFIKDRFQQVREHPGLKTVRDCQIVFLRAVRELNLSVEVPESRPPGL
jgi:phage terminase small subunit